MIKTKRFAPCIQIEVPHHHAEDEGFHLLPGEQRHVRLLPMGAASGPPVGEVLSVTPARAASGRFA